MFNQLALLMFSTLLKHDFYDIIIFSSNAKHVLSLSCVFNAMSLSRHSAHVSHVFYSFQVVKEFPVFSLHEPHPTRILSYQGILSITVVLCVNNCVYVACRHSLLTIRK